MGGWALCSAETRVCVPPAIAGRWPSPVWAIVPPGPVGIRDRGRQDPPRGFLLPHFLSVPELRWVTHGCHPGPPGSPQPPRSQARPGPWGAVYMGRSRCPWVLLALGLCGQR